MKILVTGAAGFVGQHLMPVLAASYPTAELIGSGTGSGDVRADLTDPGSVDAMIAHVRPDACVHLAAIAAVGDARANAALAWSVNLGGTLAVAEAIIRHAPACRLVFASTADLYGASFRSGLALDETALPAPLNTYAATKVAADLALGAMAAQGLNVIRVRPFNHTGPGQSANFATPSFARQIMRIKAGLQPPVLTVGDLSPMRDFLDVRDVCTAYAACLQPNLTIPSGTIFNIASGQPRRIADVLETLLSLAGVSATIEVGAGLLRKSDIPLAAGDSGLARALLGWQPRIAWERTLADVIEDWRGRVAHETH